MKAFQDSDLPGKLAQFGVHTTGQVVAIVVTAVLVVAWLITGPFIELADRISRSGKIKRKST